MAASECAALDSASLPEVKWSAASVKYRWAGLRERLQNQKQILSPVMWRKIKKISGGKQARASWSIHSLFQASLMDEIATELAWL